VASGQVFSDQWSELDKYISFESLRDGEMNWEFRKWEERYLNT